jgi:hypothetical protein
VKYEKRYQWHHAHGESVAEEAVIGHVIVLAEFGRELAISRVPTVEITVRSAGLVSEQLPAARAIGTTGKAHVWVNVRDEVSHTQASLDPGGSR